MIDTVQAVRTEPRQMTFEEARREYQSLVFAFVSRRVRPVENAEDITAHVFLDAYRTWGRLKGAPKPWLLGIARRKVCDALRKQKPFVDLKEFDQKADGMSEFIQSAEVQDAVRVVTGLPKAQREAFLMQVVDDLTIEEISQIMNRSIPAVTGLIQRARAHIQSARSSN